LIQNVKPPRGAPNHFHFQTRSPSRSLARSPFPPHCRRSRAPLSPTFPADRRLVKRHTETSPTTALPRHALRHTARAIRRATHPAFRKLRFSARKECSSGV